MNKSRTPAERGLVTGLCRDINAIWDLLQAVLQAYKSVAHAGRHTTLRPNPFIQVARRFITTARSALADLIWVVERVRNF
jgi:hypothetical protein